MAEPRARVAASPRLGRRTLVLGALVVDDLRPRRPFYRTAQAYVDGFDREVTSSWEAGGHDVGYWRRMLPAELAFLGAELG